MALTLGVDVAAGRWVGVRLRDGAFDGAAVDASFVAVLDGLGAGCAVVGVDMPTWLPRAGEERACDVAGRLLLGARRSTLFPVPWEAVLRAPTHAAASAESVRLVGRGISQQAYGLRHRILELLPVASADARVHEVHPECSFATLAGAPVAASKRSWAGARARARLLRGAGIDLPEDLGPGGAGAVPVDDVLDAAVCAWTAGRIAAGAALALPEGTTERLSAIWR